jgi:succinate-acetate transporter protein
MGWRGSGGDGAATVGAFYFFGGLLQVIGSLLEWIIGNAFIYVVFGSFGKSLLPRPCLSRDFNFTNHQHPMAPL